MKFKKSTYYLIKNCLKLFSWETERYDGNDDVYKWLLDIIVLLDIKLGELIEIEEVEDEII